MGSGGAQGIGSSGSYGLAVSGDGRYVAFDSASTNLVPGDTNGLPGRLRPRPVAGTTTRVSVGSGGTQGNSFSYRLAISADGRYVAFDSTATNLVPGDTNGTDDIFVRDRSRARPRA